MLFLPAWFAGAQAVSTYTVAKPAFQAASAADEELQFSVQTPPSSVAGLRVFLDPPPKSPLTTKNPGYVGVVYFSEGSPPEQSFTLPVPKLIKKHSHLVLVPLDASGEKSPRVKVAIKRARMVSVKELERQK